jgi:hypothetical protein
VEVGLRREDSGWTGCEEKRRKGGEDERKRRGKETGRIEQKRVK